MATGASQWNVVAGVGGQAARLTAIGLAAGVLTAAAATRRLSTLRYGVSPLDVRAFAAVTIGLGLAALLASYIPVRRAALVDPMAALREE